MHIFLCSSYCDQYPLLALIAAGDLAAINPVSISLLMQVLMPLQSVLSLQLVEFCIAIKTSNSAESLGFTP